MTELLDIDWRQAYIDYNRARKAPDDSGYWDGRAKDFSHYARTSAYAATFIDNLELPVLDGSPELDGAVAACSLLDMGCGSGTLAIPLARAGHHVLAADFSLGMLAELERSIAVEGLQGVSTMQLDFNAPWQTWLSAGLAEDCVDIALASRSTMVDDMWAAFEKLERVARSKVAVTLATGNGPRTTLRLGEAMAGAEGHVTFVPDYVFAMNILFQMDRAPELRYINADKRNKEGQMQKIRWAFISWDVL